LVDTPCKDAKTWDDHDGGDVGLMWVRIHYIRISAKLGKGIREITRVGAGNDLFHKFTSRQCPRSLHTPYAHHFIIRLLLATRNRRKLKRLENGRKNG
jgi:hypothetical protein